MTASGTELPSGDVRIHGEYWRVSGPLSDVGNLGPLLFTDFDGSDQPRSVTQLCLELQSGLRACSNQNEEEIGICDGFG